MGGGGKSGESEAGEQAGGSSVPWVGHDEDFGALVEGLELRGLPGLSGQGGVPRMAELEMV